MTKHQKKIESCIVCWSPVRATLAYHGSYTRIYENKITGKSEVEELSGAICPECYRRLGYRVNRKKLKEVKANA